MKEFFKLWGMLIVGFGAAIGLVAAGIALGCMALKFGGGWGLAAYGFLVFTGGLAWIAHDTGEDIGW